MAVDIQENHVMISLSMERKVVELVCCEIWVEYSVADDIQDDVFLKHHVCRKLNACLLIWYVR